MYNLHNQDPPATPLQGFDAIESFIRAFLLCDDHQRTILTLWIANTWCFSRFHTIPYLDVRSPEPQCGKSVCLQLLELLACEPALVTAAAPSTLLGRLLEKRSLSELKKNKVDGTSLKGYRLQDFQDAWERYAGPLATARDRENSVAGSQLQ
jgi:hypothetical protein